MWTCQVSDLLDYSEPSSRVFLFENILLLVVPTAAVCSSKRMIPLETIKRDMTTLGIITQSLLVPLNQVPDIVAQSKNVVCHFLHCHACSPKCHVPLCLYLFVDIAVLYTSPCCAFRICIMHGFRLDPLTLSNRWRVRVAFLNTYVGCHAAQTLYLRRGQFPGLSYS